jgi:uroporphyrinogen-III synthase
VRVLITRTADRCKATAARLETRGHQAVVLPLSRYDDTQEAIPPGMHDAIAFTSAAAVESIARRISLFKEQEYLFSVPAWCVGLATASAAQRLGFRDVRTAGGDGAALARSILQGYSGTPGKRILLPTQANLSFDLKDALPGLETAAMVAYRVVGMDPGREKLAAALGQAEVVFAYSPASTSHLVALCENHGLAERLMRLTLVAISEKTAAVLGKHDRAAVRLALSPDEDAMIRQLER